jgi:hypothetical protein
MARRALGGLAYQVLNRANGKLRLFKNEHDPARMAQAKGREEMQLKVCVTFSSYSQRPTDKSGRVGTCKQGGRKHCKSKLSPHSTLPQEPCLQLLL